MAALLACWVVYPLLLILLGLGAGSIVQGLAGRPLALALRLPCGIALLMVVLDLATRISATASLAVPAAVAVGLAGLVLAPPRPRRPINPAVIAGGIVFAIYAAPVVLSGEATWSGYIKLDDTSTFVALVDRVLEHGHTLSGLNPSTYSATLGANLPIGYPLGSFLPLAFGDKLLGLDMVWLADPWMAVMAALLALALYEIVRRALPTTPTWVTVAIAAVAAQSALLYGYYLWGGLKELATAFLIAAFALCAPLVLERERPLRAAIPAIVVLWALFAAVSAAGPAVWIGPGVVLVALAVGRRRPPMPPLAVVVGAVGVIAVLGYLALAPGGFVQRAIGELTNGVTVGNLIGPLKLEQLAGVWPAGDFRSTPAALSTTRVLIALVVVGAGLGLVWAIVMRRLELALYMLCALAGALIIFAVGSPWLAGKALAVASPALPLGALVGAAMVAQWGHREAAVLLGGAMAVGVLWSNAYAFHDASLAPRTQYAELADIGHRISGQGPTFMTEYNPYGARHFLRAADTESASELRVRLDPLLSGQGLPKGASADLDRFQLSTVLTFRTIVLQRSPAASRPPTPYQLVLEDRFWQVWQRPAVSQPSVLAHTPLGDDIHPGGVPACSDVLALARTPGAVTLAGPAVVNPVVVAVSSGQHPPRWSDGSSFLTLNTPGEARIPISVPAPGRYSLWLGGSMRGPVTLSVDGRPAGEVRNEIQEAGQYVPFDTLTLDRGTHVVSLRYETSWLPGSGGPPDTVGPLMVAPAGGPPSVLRVPVAQASTLCGRNLDWIEALGA